MAVTKKMRARMEELKSLIVEPPMSSRQIFYQMVSRGMVENDRKNYNTLCRNLKNARRAGIIPWEWLEDRTRRPRSVSMWDGLPGFAETAMGAYRRNVWATQPVYIEAWLEKDALSAVVEEVIKPYGVTLTVARGFSSIDAIHNAAERFLKSGKPVSLLYLGDFDPSGEQMPRALRKSLAEFRVEPEIVRVALNLEDIATYKLLRVTLKKKDKRTPAFIAKYGDNAAELDALPIDVLRRRLKETIEARMDLDALSQARRREAQEREELARRLAS